MSGAHKLDINMTLVYLVTIFTGMLIYLTVIAAQTYYYQVDQYAFESRVLTKNNYELEQYKTEQQKVLHGYEWLDVNTKTVRIPIEDAIAVTAKEFQAGTYPNYEAIIPDPTGGAAHN
jgi:uncharacterized protein with von Willebrand factor type A (vWA) domain